MRIIRILAGFLLLSLLAIPVLAPVLVVPESLDQQKLFEAEEGRRSITFIMGEDSEGHSYYRHAADHFTLHPKESTDLVISNCRTIGNVIEFLNQSVQRGCRPWSVINIVAHGNPQTGLNLYITEEGFKATPKRLIQELLLGNLPSIEQGIIDDSTRVNIWSCGIGKSPMINIAMQRIFRSVSGDTAQVYCSPHFVIFHPSMEKRTPYRLNASYWPYYYKRGYRPGNLEIAKALKTQYPEATIDWMSALTIAVEEDPDSLSHGQYHIPVSYTRIYSRKEDRPDFSSEKEKLNWALSQPALIEQIEETGIPDDRFHWTVNKIIYTREDGSQVPAIKAIGMATVLFILHSAEDN